MRIRKSLKHVLKNKKGFTLVELAVSIGIMSIIMFGAVSVFFMLYENYHETQIRSQQLVIVEGITDLMSEEVRYSTSLIVGTNEDAATTYASYNTIEEEDGILYLNGEILWDSTDLNQSVDLEFSYSEEAPYTLYMNIVVTNTSDFNTGYSTQESIAIKLINMELKSTKIQNISVETSSDIIIYKYEI